MRHRLHFLIGLAALLGTGCATVAMKDPVRARAGWIRCWPPASGKGSLVGP